jgi:hypothetical protein
MKKLNKVERGSLLFARSAKVSARMKYSRSGMAMKSEYFGKTTFVNKSKIR